MQVRTRTETLQALLNQCLRGFLLGHALFTYQVSPSPTARHHIIASRLSATAFDEQAAPQFAKEVRFGYWLSRHASLEHCY